MKKIKCRKISEELEEQMTERKLIIWLDSGDTLMNEGTEYRKEGSPIVDHAQMVDGAKEMLRALKQEGFVMELVADGYTQSFDNCFRQHQLGEFFKARTISEEVGAEKPSAQMFETAMEKLRLKEADKSRVIMVGNNLKRDIVGANRFGVTSVWFAWSPRYPMKPETEEETPDYVIRHPMELVTLAKQLDEQLELESGCLRTGENSR